MRNRLDKCTDSVKDVLARRTRLAFLNAQAAFEALPRVVEIMAEELKWGDERQKKEFEAGTIRTSS
jgi:glycerol-3-phosphate dehydrogenase